VSSERCHGGRRRCAHRMRQADAPVTPTATAGGARARGTLVQRVRARLVAAGSWLACRLPEQPLTSLAELAGDLHYRLAAGRADLVRANLRRVHTWMDGQGVGASSVRLAARDDVALERLVRSAFRHHARYYLEVARTPGMTPGYLAERAAPDDPELLDGLFRQERPLVFVGLHFGALELPALYLAQRYGRQFVGPMETIDDPPLQDWFRRTRGSVGVRIIGLREARRELGAAIRRGEPVGLVADRDLTGGGIETELFGHPAPMPAGPALLALDSGAVVQAVAVRRTKPGYYRARILPLEIPMAGERRARVTSFLEQEVRAFEQLIADAPDQWWAVFFPIWPDLKPERRRPSTGTGPDPRPAPGSENRP
jgi:lauroyl/myristoyl acyltransferase